MKLFVKLSLPSLKKGLPKPFHISLKILPLFGSRVPACKKETLGKGVSGMTIDLTESEFNACDIHIISMIRDLEAARATVKA